MATKDLSLVKYAGEYWVTLADFTETRSTEGYSDHASVKSAIRSFIVRTFPDKYIAFRGEQQLKNIIKENEGNNLFIPEDLKGHTRTALIHWDMLESLSVRFKVSPEYKQIFQDFISDATEAMKEDTETTEVEDDNPIEGRSATIRFLRNEIQRLDREVEARQKNREKLLQALNALESLEITDM